MRQPNFRYVVGGLTLVLIIVITLAWCSASDVTKVPKAEKYANAANVAQTESRIAETEANSARSQIAAVEAKRQSAKDETEAWKPSIHKAENNLNKRKADYEFTRKAKPVVSADDLAARERKLLADLRNIQQ